MSSNIRSVLSLHVIDLRFADQYEQMAVNLDPLVTAVDAHVEFFTNRYITIFGFNGTLRSVVFNQQTHELRRSVFLALRPWGNETFSSAISRAILAGTAFEQAQWNQRNNPYVSLCVYASCADRGDRASISEHLQKLQELSNWEVRLVGLHTPNSRIGFVQRVETQTGLDCAQMVDVGGEEALSRGIASQANELLVALKEGYQQLFRYTML